VNPVTLFHLSEPLAWRALDGTWVVYQARTGAIYPLDTLAATVLTLLESAPLPTAELVSQMASESGLLADSVLADSIQDTLAQLCQLGLVAAVGGPPAW